MFIRNRLNIGEDKRAFIRSDEIRLSDGNHVVFDEIIDGTDVGTLGFHQFDEHVVPFPQLLHLQFTELFKFVLDQPAAHGALNFDDFLQSFLLGDELVDVGGQIGEKASLFRGNQQTRTVIEHRRVQNGFIADFFRVICR